MIEGSTVRGRGAADTDRTPPITALKGIGPKLAERLRRLGLHTAADALLHLPLRYQDRGRVTAIGQLQPGMEAQVEAVVASSEVTTRGRRCLLCRLSDGTGILTLRFFISAPPSGSGLASRTRGCAVSARSAPSYGGGLEMIHPECRRLDADPPPMENRLTPIYPATAGLQQFTLRGLAEQALEQLDSAALLPEWLPPVLLAQLQLSPIAEAVRLLHQPPVETPVAELRGRHPARRAIGFRGTAGSPAQFAPVARSTRRQAAPPLAGGGLSQRFVERLPFALTVAQQRVLAEIAADLANLGPCCVVAGRCRLRQTVVAAAACCGRWKTVPRRR